MMELCDVLNQMIQENLVASQPTNLCIGTVTSVEPLEVTISTDMEPLKSQVLYLTAAVIEKKLPILEHYHTTKGFRHAHTVSGLSHSHSANEGDTGPALEGEYPTSDGLAQDAFDSDKKLIKAEIVCYEYGKPLPVKDGFIILNRALEQGDRVLLLRVQNGQKFIILSRVFEQKEAFNGNPSNQRH